MRLSRTIVATFGLLLLATAVCASTETVTRGSGISADVASDGRVLIELDGGIWVVPPRGGSAEPIDIGPGAARHPRWSPDASSIAFEAIADGLADVRVVDVQSGQVRNLGNIGTAKFFPAWHPDGDPERSHTRVAKGQSKAKKRQRPVDAIIYVNVKRITPSHKSYSRGTLMHELVHALDLASGRYHDDYVIREKRAVFFQNIWRMSHSVRLRSHYHQKFKTPEYQQALDAGLINEFVEYFFKYNDLP